MRIMHGMQPVPSPEEFAALARIVRDAAAPTDADHDALCSLFGRLAHADSDAELTRKLDAAIDGSLWIPAAPSNDERGINERTLYGVVRAAASLDAHLTIQIYGHDEHGKQLPGRYEHVAEVIENLGGSVNASIDHARGVWGTVEIVTCKPSVAEIPVEVDASEWRPGDTAATEAA